MLQILQYAIFVSHNRQKLGKNDSFMVTTQKLGRPVPMQLRLWPYRILDSDRMTTVRD